MPPSSASSSNGHSRTLSTPLNLGPTTLSTEWNKGRLVWIPDEQAGFLPGSILESSDDEMLTVALESGGVRNVLKVDLSATNPTNYDSAKDIADLPYLNEASVLYHLRGRYLKGSIYTYSGLFLVAVNPYQQLSIYTPKVLASYQGRRRDENEPHVYAVAEKAWGNMREHLTSQSVLVTGESGAGKTENTKKVIQYLAAIARTPVTLSASASVELLRSGELGMAIEKMGDGTLEKQILEANPILEAFGNAQTVKNSNSSRFGKFVRIFFDAGGRIAGANIDWYLLEKSRVTGRSEKERNFHAFFWLLQGASRGLKDRLLLTGGARDYGYLNKGMLVVEGMDDTREWDLLVAALGTVGFTTQEQFNLFKVIAAILHLGNIQVSERSGQAFIPSTTELQKVCHLLGIDDDKFSKALVSPKIKAGKDWVNQSRTSQQVCDEIAALAKGLYERNFGKTVERINKALGRPVTKTFIGVLDIAGFEIFEINGFEQLCINLTNEKLQQFFNYHMFVLEQEEYRTEEISWNFENFGAELQPTIDLIESNNPMGILSSLDDACILPKATDRTFTNKLEELSKQNPIQHHPGDATPSTYPYSKFTPSRFASGFTVSHYAGEVEYRSDGWLEKNRDPLNDNISALFASSSDPYTASLFSDYVDTSIEVGPRSKVKRGAFKTVGQRHKDQLGSLMKQLEETQPHFVRCIVPNLTKSPGVIDTRLVLGQLQCNGVLEGIRIARKGYPNRLGFSEFRRRFEVLAGETIRKGSFMDGGEACEKILKSLGLEEGLYKRGRTKIFFKAGILAKLEEQLDAYLYNTFTAIQAACRRFNARRQINKALNHAAAVKTIQRNARIYNQLQSWPWWSLFVKVRPLLAAARSDDELRRQAAELAARKEDAERELLERRKLEERKDALEKERVSMEALLAAEVATSLEKEISLKRKSEKVDSLEMEIEGLNKDLSIADGQLNRALAAKKDVQERAAASLADSNKLIDALRLEQKAWETREAQLLNQTTLDTKEFDKILEERENFKAEIGTLKRKIVDQEEDSRKVRERMEEEIVRITSQLDKSLQEVNEARKKLISVEKEGKSASDDVEALRKDKSVSESKLSAVKVELDRVMQEQSYLIKDKDAVTLRADSLEIRLAAATKESLDQTRSLQSARDATTRAEQEVVSIRKLLDDKISDHDRQSDSTKIAEAGLSELRKKLSQMDGELSKTVMEAATKASALESELQASKRDGKSLEREIEEFSRKEKTYLLRMEELERSNQDYLLKQEAHQLEVELIRTTTAEKALKEREKSAREVSEIANRCRVLEDTTVDAERTRDAAIRDAEALKILLEQEEMKVQSKERARRALEADKEHQYSLLADYDKVNANLRAELNKTKSDLVIADARSAPTVVEHYRVLEEAQRLQNAQFAAIKEQESQREAYIATLVKSRNHAIQLYEDALSQKDADAQQKWIDRSTLPKGDENGKILDALEKEQKVRQAAELNINRLSNEIRHLQKQLQDSTQESASLRLSNRSLEREIQEIAVSDHTESMNVGNGRTYQNSPVTRISTRPASPTKLGNATPTNSQAPRRRYD